ncbi:MAG: peptidase S8 [Candidatus Velthaea sp.]
MFKNRLFQGIAVCAVFALPACSTGGSSAQVPTTQASATDTGAVSTTIAKRSVESARAFAANCSGTAAVLETGNCTNIEVAGTALGASATAAQIPGFHPADLQSAYKLPASTAGKGQTIGIVVIGTDANLESDLAVYRKTFGLPACTSASGCLKILTGTGAPAASANWAHEASIDVDMASAVCPNCKLIVAQIATNAAVNLVGADAAVVKDGATVVSNSFAIPESAPEANATWAHTGVPIVAAAGDTGYSTANWPAAATDVIAVGATTLTANAATARGWTETAWSGTGSACSAVAAKPSWQLDSGCSMRTVADVAAVGDPNTPVAVYDTYEDNGWIQMGGTSVSAPIVAGVYALAGNGASLTGAQSLYTHASSLFPVTSGSNGICTVAYLCTAEAGYNGPSGMGSPDGIAAF